MASKALSKKTFGIINQTWLGSYKCFITGIIAIKLGLIALEALFCIVQKSFFENYNDYDYAVVWYFFLSTLCIEGGYCSLLSFNLASKHYRKIFITNLIYSFFLTFFFNNPFIIESIRLAKRATKDYKFSIGFHFLSVPVFLVNSYFITYVLWRMSKVKPDYDGDEPYLVIYGDEGSSTKQIDLDSG